MKNAAAVWRSSGPKDGGKRERKMAPSQCSGNDGCPGLARFSLPASVCLFHPLPFLPSFVLTSLLLGDEADIRSILFGTVLKVKDASTGVSLSYSALPWASGKQCLPSEGLVRQPSSPLPSLLLLHSSTSDPFPPPLSLSYHFEGWG